ncbi:MAG: hypothetical protein HQK89_12860 [Nitrospirae bacterium]|nr:hypothetical protein [Nitrospirota bacterium]
MESINTWLALTCPVNHLVMDIKKKSIVKNIYRPDPGSGEVLQVCEEGGVYKVDVVFEKDGKRILETLQEKILEPFDNIFQKFEKGISDKPLDFFLKQLAYQFPLENSGGELSNSKTDILERATILRKTDRIP